MTAVILSHPVPSPIVFGAKQAVNSCNIKNAISVLSRGDSSNFAVGFYLFTDGRHFGFALEDSAAHKFDNIFAAQRIPDAVTGQNHEFIVGCDGCSFDIGQRRYHLFFGFQIFVLRKETNETIGIVTGQVRCPLLAYCFICMVANGSRQIQAAVNSAV